MIFPGDPGLNMALRPSSYTNFQPRVGIAWQPLGPKTVFRAGFGIFVAPLESAQINEAVGVAPFSPFFNFVGAPGSPISLRTHGRALRSPAARALFPLSPRTRMFLQARRFF